VGWAAPWISAELRAGKSSPFFSSVSFLFSVLLYTNLYLLFCFAGFGLAIHLQDFEFGITYQK
jgi:hypothetical protein